MTGWRECLLGDVVELKRGYDLPTALRMEGPYPIVSSSGVTGSHCEAKVKGPGVVTGRYGTLGEVFFVLSDFWPLNTSLYVRDFKGNDIRFTGYFLSSLGLGDRNSAGAVPGLNRNHLHQMQVRMPPVSAQRRIAFILSAYDNLIENNTRRIAILEEMARRLYEEWFIHFRFPGHSDLSWSSQLPPRWRYGRMDEVISVSPEAIKLKNAPNTINYIDIASVGPGSVHDIQSMGFSDAPSRARRIVQSGDVLWSCVRPNRRSHALILDPEPNTVASTGFAVLRAKRVPFSFLFQAVKTDEFVSYLVNHATGAAYPAVKQADFEAAPILLPPQELLDGFDAIVKPMLELTHVLEKKNTNLRAQRDLLLPKLVSGEIDVSEAPLPAAAEEDAVA